jgi:hypothetical protein
LGANIGELNSHFHGLPLLRCPLLDLPDAVRRFHEPVFDKPQQLLHAIYGSFGASFRLGRLLDLE